MRMLPSPVGIPSSVEDHTSEISQSEPEAIVFESHPVVLVTLSMAEMTSPPPPPPPPDDASGIPFSERIPLYVGYT